MKKTLTLLVALSFVPFVAFGANNMTSSDNMNTKDTNNMTSSDNMNTKDTNNMASSDNMNSKDKNDSTTKMQIQCPSLAGQGQALKKNAMINAGQGGMWKVTKLEKNKSDKNKSDKNSDANGDANSGANNGANGGALLAKKTSGGIIGSKQKVICADKDKDIKVEREIDSKWKCEAQKDSSTFSCTKK